MRVVNTACASSFDRSRNEKVDPRLHYEGCSPLHGSGAAEIYGHMGSRNAELALLVRYHWGCKCHA